MVRSYIDPYARIVKGEKYGIEIEVEGNALPRMINSIWSQVPDGSLRGRGCEFVTKDPVPFDRLEEHIRELIAHLAANCRLNVSDRCGVHLHVNVQNLKINHLFCFLVLYYIIEDSLIDIFSSERKGNLFCLAASEAEGIIDDIVKVIDLPSTIVSMFTPDFSKYAALNLSSIYKYGSVEFRAFSTPKNIDDLIKIIDLARFFSKLKRDSKAYMHPRQIIEECSSLGEKEFVKKHYPFLLNKIENPSNVIFKGIRLIQEVAFSFPGD